MAVEVGVTHKPDVTMHTLTPEDRYLILASDGVWELISSQVGSSSYQLHECLPLLHQQCLGNLPMNWPPAQ